MVNNLKRNFALTLIILIGIAIVYMLRIYVTPIFSGIVLSFLVYPIYNYINKKSKKPRFSAVIVLLGVFLVILIPLSTIAGLLLNQVNNFDLSSARIEHFEKSIYDISGQNISISKGVASAQVKIKEEAKNTLPELISFTSNFLLSVFIMFFIMFYLLVQKDFFMKSFISILPFSKKSSNFLIEGSANVIRAVLIGQVFTAIIQGLLGMVSFLIVGIKGAVLWGVIMIILSIIPVVGAFLVWIPAGLFLILDGNLTGGIFVLVWGAVVVSQVDNFIRPYLVNRFADIHPLETFLGIFMGLSAFGFIGIILGPLIISLFKTLVKVFRQEYSLRVKG